MVIVRELWAIEDVRRPSPENLFSNLQQILGSDGVTGSERWTEGGFLIQVHDGVILCVLQLFGGHTLLL